MSVEDILSAIAIIVPLGALWFGFWTWGTIGDLKKTNQRLNDELKRLTDRDGRGRFTRKEDKK
jgi:hypothetical protein